MHTVCDMQRIVDELYVANANIPRVSEDARILASNTASFIFGLQDSIRVAKRMAEQRDNTFYLKSVKIARLMAGAQELLLQCTTFTVQNA